MASSIKKVLAVVLCTFVLYCSSNTVQAQRINQQVFLDCFTEKEAHAILLKNNEKLVFTGVNNYGAVTQLWSSSDSYTLFILTPDGLYCTSYHHVGDTLSLAVELNLGNKT